MSTIWTAALWGSIAGISLLIGGLVGINGRVSLRAISLILALGGGVLIALVALELMQASYVQGGFFAAGVGVMAGAFTFFLADVVLARLGARHRKEPVAQPSSPQSGLSIFVGSLLDSVPEAVAIGVSLIRGGAMGWVLVVGIFLANVPEGLSATSGMLRAGRTRTFVLGLWGAAVLLTAVASASGFVLLAHVPPAYVGLTQSFASGAILAMLASTVFPEAFKDGGPVVGLLTAIGFLIAFFLSKLG